MGDIALALCGGGGKGAFQIGAWRSLIEHGVMDNVKAISGTSVGALNAVLLAIGDFENAEKIWYGIRKRDMLDPYIDEPLNPFGSVCSRDGLEAILKKVPLDALHNSDVDVYVTIFNTEKLDVEYIHLNELPVYEMIKYLLASSAILKLYPSVKIKNKNCIDAGGINFWNTPIEPLYQLGYKNVYVISLNHKFNIQTIFSLEGIINAYEKFPGCNFNVIKPARDLGGLIQGTLDFSTASIELRICEGYSSANDLLDNEGEYDMDHTELTEINVMIAHKMETLFTSAEDIEDFIRAASFGMPNIAMKTLGGEVWYKNIVEMYGWKVQQHQAPFMEMHYRILDSQNVRRAYVFNPKDILNALEAYEKTERFNARRRRTSEYF